MSMAGNAIHCFSKTEGERERMEREREEGRSMTAADRVQEHEKREEAAEQCDVWE